MKLLASEELSKEVVQETFIRLWEKREALDPEKSISAYLFTISKNLVKDYQAQYARQYKLNKEMWMGESCEDTVIAGISFDEIRKIEAAVVQKLPPQQKEVYVLSRHEDLSHQEIAERLGISINSVKTHLRLALKALKNQISPTSEAYLIVTLLLSQY